MRWKQIENEPKTFALIFETGDEIARVLQEFAKGQSLAGSSFKAIGALSYAKLVGSTGRQKNTIQPAFSTNKWKCFRSLATSLSRTESRRCTHTW
jgi:predicted DNA-binding protein with PD1-like motif